MPQCCATRVELGVARYAVGPHVEVGFSSGGVDTDGEEIGERDGFLGLGETAHCGNGKGCEDEKASGTEELFSVGDIGHAHLAVLRWQFQLSQNMGQFTAFLL